ncbi:MAG: D-alanine--D-alanine ligase, partial [Flavobacteriaceae bacterium]|nr:D-alanine--D-alanine ligase [Flavobacteriaceae bacterium]
MEDEIIEDINIKKNIAIIMGGFSTEYEISIKSGQVVYETLNEIYNCYRIHIFKDRWAYVDDGGIEHPIDKNDFTVEVEGTQIFFDCVFNAIHGSPGEDGFMQAYLDLVEIPHTSCDMYQAALTFNKRDCLTILKKHGIKAANSYFINKGDEINTQEIINTVGLPC